MTTNSIRPLSTVKDPEIQPTPNRPEIYPQKSPEVHPGQNESEISTGVNDPEIFPQRSPHIDPDQAPNEVPPLNDPTRPDKAA